MASSLARFALRSSRAVRSQMPASASMGARRMMGTFEDREKGEEVVYFRKEEAAKLKKVLAKMEKERDEGVEELKGILTKHGAKVSPEVIEEIVAWKHH